MTQSLRILQTPPNPLFGKEGGPETEKRGDRNRVERGDRKEEGRRSRPHLRFRSLLFGRPSSVCSIAAWTLLALLNNASFVNRITSIPRPLRYWVRRASWRCCSGP